MTVPPDTVARPGAQAPAGRAAAPATARAAGRARRRCRPVTLIAVSCLVAALLALPLVFLLIEAAGSGTGQVAQLIFRGLTWQLLWNTVKLTVVVTALCAVIGTAAAWCVRIASTTAPKSNHPRSSAMRA